VAADWQCIFAAGLRGLALCAGRNFGALMKYLLIFIAIVLGLFMAKKQWRAAQDKLRKDDLAVKPVNSDAAANVVENAPQSMVACAHCGVYLAQNQALTKNGRSFCSAEHLQADQHAKPGSST
jgi:hypothetical protein